MQLEGKRDGQQDRGHSLYTAMKGLPMLSVRSALLDSAHTLRVSIRVEGGWGFSHLPRWLQGTWRSRAWCPANRSLLKGHGCQGSCIGLCQGWGWGEHGPGLAVGPGCTPLHAEDWALSAGSAGPGPAVGPGCMPLHAEGWAPLAGRAGASGCTGPAGSQSTSLKTLVLGLMRPRAAA